VVGAVDSLSARHAEKRAGRAYRLFAAALFGALPVFMLAGCGCGPEPSLRGIESAPYRVGAYYYLWYPSNFQKGYLREALVPPQRPELGLYDSLDPEVVERHIAWCSRYGIDFLALDFWPGRRDSFRAIERGFLQARNIGDIRFCIFFETWMVAFDPPTGTIRFDTGTIRSMKQSLLEIARRWFDHPSYLRVDGRPVVVLYLSRIFCGDYARAVLETRRALRREGHDVFLVGDEIFWEGVRNRAAGRGVRKTSTPLTGRIRLFDAVTAYNYYESGKSAHAGYAENSRFFGDVGELLSRFRRAARGHAALVPSVMPGYNDRGTRPAEAHYVIPRSFAPGEGLGSFFARCIERIGIPWMDPGLSMILVTSFNEWNEDTSIEPVAAAPSTSDDVSGSGFFTQGYDYVGYGERCLEVLRDRFSAVCGRVTREDGSPAQGIEVRAFWDNRFAARGKTDRKGYYTLSRGGMPPGNYTVHIREGRPGRRVRVRKDRCARGVDFTIRRSRQESKAGSRPAGESPEK
jgi:hypothetical protein